MCLVSVTLRLVLRTGRSQQPRGWDETRVNPEGRLRCLERVELKVRSNIRSGSRLEDNERSLTFGGPMAPESLFSNV